MKWPRLFAGAERALDSPQPEQPAPPTAKTFAVDRTRMFNLAQTNALAALFAAPASSRDRAWQAAFFGAVWNASLEVGTPPVFQGPDGLPYLRLHVPTPSTPFDSNSLANLAGQCVVRGHGAAIFPAPEATAPEYVLSLGLLDCLLRYDSWEGDPQDVQEMRGAPTAGGMRQETLERAREVMLGTPSADYLPPVTARALHRYLTAAWQMADPRVRLMMDQQSKPTRSLIISRRLSEFPDPAQASTMFRMVTWFLPPLRGLMLLPDGWSIEEMTPLAELGRLGE